VREGKGGLFLVLSEIGGDSVAFKKKGKKKDEKKDKKKK
jgi:hypothetical protein